MPHFGSAGMWKRCGLSCAQESFEILGWSRTQTTTPASEGLRGVVQDRRVWNNPGKGRPMAWKDGEQERQKKAARARPQSAILPERHPKRPILLGRRSFCLRTSSSHHRHSLLQYRRGKETLDPLARLKVTSAKPLARGRARTMLDRTSAFQALLQKQELNARLNP